MTEGRYLGEWKEFGGIVEMKRRVGNTTGKEAKYIMDFYANTFRKPSAMYNKHVQIRKKIINFYLK